jgi:hypothetical protein
VTRQHTTGKAPLERLQDEIYRQMFRLEAGRRSADVLLAVALLRAWMALEREPAQSEPRQWLRSVCPVCLSMIGEASECDGDETCSPGDNNDARPQTARVNHKNQKG